MRRIPPSRLRSQLFDGDLEEQIEDVIENHAHPEEERVKISSLKEPRGVHDRQHDGTETGGREEGAQIVTRGILHVRQRERLPFRFQRHFPSFSSDLSLFRFESINLVGKMNRAIRLSSMGTDKNELLLLNTYDSSVDQY